MVQTVIEKILRVLSREDQYEMSEDYLFDLINEAQRKLSVYSQKPFTEEVDIIPGDVETDMPSDAKRVLEVYWGSTGDTDKVKLRPAMCWPPLDEEFMEEISTTGEADPIYYYIKAGKILFDPSPLSESRLYIVYEGRPRLIEDPEDPLAYDDSEEFIVNHVIYQFFVNTGDSISAREWRDRMSESLFEWINASDNQNYAQPLRIKMTW